MAKLMPEQIELRLAALHDWTLSADQSALVRDFTFPDFAAALIFVNRIADLAEQSNHHPDIDIRYNRVRLSLTSHDSGGITTRDFNLATKISAL